MKNSQYNWNWWFVLSILFLLISMVFSTALHGGSFTNITLIVAAVNLIICLYVGLKPEQHEADLDDEALAEMYAEIQRIKRQVQKEQEEKIVKFNQMVEEMEAEKTKKSPPVDDIYFPENNSKE